MTKILVTGVCGFIGFSLCQKLLQSGESVVGVDNINDYYDPELKNQRLKILQNYQNFNFIKLDLSVKSECEAIKNLDIKYVFHFAAQAGVRYSLLEPDSYFNSNLIGSYNLLEIIKNKNINHYFFASTSSVYGDTFPPPFAETMHADFPIQFYAATKRASEILSHSYFSVNKLPVTIFRFFTVYGPWGRPDMSLFKFTRSILNGEKIELYNNGNHIRSFTYIDDLIEIIYKYYKIIEVKNEIRYSIFNIGNPNSINLSTYIKIIEQNLKLKATVTLTDKQIGDIVSSIADSDAICNLVGFESWTPIEFGIRKFINWYKSYYEKY